MKCAIAIRKEKNELKIKKRYIDYFIYLGYDVEIIDTNSNLEKYDLFILPGGDDLNPNLYYEQNMYSNNIDEYNDKLDYKIITHCIKENKRLLGICRGIQAINIYFGGSLYQNVDNHMKNNHFIIYKNKNYLVNSYHHQSIKKIGKNIEVLSKSIDDSIEIIKYKKIIGVAFHPEMINTPIINKLIFQLINEF